MSNLYFFPSLKDKYQEHIGLAEAIRQGDITHTISFVSGDNGHIAYLIRSTDKTAYMLGIYEPSHSLVFTECIFTEEPSEEALTGYIKSQVKGERIAMFKAV